MKSVSQDAVRDLLFLSLAAGSADAAGYMGFGRVFTSNMTGNIVLLGIDLGQNHLTAAGRTLFVLATFTAGVAIGGRLGQGIGEKNWPRLAARLIGLEKMALILFALGWAMGTNLHGVLVDGGLLFLLTLAMGLQSAAMNRLGAPGANTTAITGTLTALVTGLIEVWTAREPETIHNRLQRIKFQSAMIGLYCVGAAGCGFLITHVYWLAGCLPGLASLAVWPSSQNRI